VPPVSRKQQKYVFAQADKGVAWAKKWVAEGAMKVKKKKRRVT
jgi:hypothetical protein